MRIRKIGIPLWLLQLKPRMYSLTSSDCLVIKETVKSSSDVKFKKILKLLFKEPLTMALFRTTTQKSLQPWTKVLRHFNQFRAMQP